MLNLTINGQAVETMADVERLVGPDISKVNDPDDERAFDRAFFLAACANELLSGEYRTYTDAQWAKYEQECEMSPGDEES